VRQREPTKLTRRAERHRRGGPGQQDVDEGVLHAALVLPDDRALSAADRGGEVLQQLEGRLGDGPGPVRHAFGGRDEAAELRDPGGEGVGIASVLILEHARHGWLTAGAGGVAVASSSYVRLT